MSNIDDIMTEDMAATMFDVDTAESPAETVTYTPPGGQAASIIAVFLPEDTDISDDEYGDVQIRQQRVIIPTDSAIGVQEPVIQAEITRDGTQWRVITIDSKGGGKAILTIRTDTPLSKHHESHKQKIE